MRSIGVLPAAVAGLAGLISCSPAFSADTLIPKSSARAVDGINYKIEAYGGSVNGQGTGGVVGAVTIPLGDRFGVQFDAMAGSLQSEFVGGVAAHLFWRDPSRGMVGLYASHTHWNIFTGLNTSHFAAEGELYLGRFTLQAIAGVEDGNATQGAAGPLFISYNVENRFFDAINLHYYVQDNWRLTLGHRYMGGIHAAALATEFAFNVSGNRMMTAFAEARLGENDFRGIYAGMKMYFGQRSKPLIQRHRQDDPSIWLTDTQSTMMNSRTISKSITTDECVGLNGEIVSVGDGYCRLPGGLVPISDYIPPK